MARSQLFALLLSSCLISSLVAQVPQYYGDITLSPIEGPKAALHGYDELRLTIKNDGKTSHVVQLAAPYHNHSGSTSDHLGKVRQTVTVSPEATVQVSLFFPPLPHLGRDVEVKIDNDTRKPLNVSIGERIDDESKAYVLRGSLVPEATLKGMSTDKSDPVAAMLHRLRPLFDYTEQKVSDVRTFPTNWLGYTRYDGVLLLDKEWSVLTAESRHALIQYVEAGGTLIVIGKPDLPTSWLEKGAPQGMKQLNAVFGLALVVPNRGLDPEYWAVEPNSNTETPRGLLLKSLAWTKQGLTFHRPNPWMLNSSFPVVDSERIPVGILFILLLVFVVLIGPVNLIVLSRLKRRMLILFTIPSISFVTCVLVFGSVILAEGWSGTNRTVGLTVLDHRTNHAITIGWMGLYSPVSPREGLTFQPLTEVLPVVTSEEDHRHGRSSSQRSIMPRQVDWVNNKQHLSSGWIAARIPCHVRFRSVQEISHRVLIQKESDGSYSAVNSLGQDILTLRYADPLRNIHEAQGILRGERASLTMTKNRAQSDPPALRQHFSGSWLSEVAPDIFLQPNSYLAEVNVSPYIENPLERAVNRLGTSHILGILDNEQ